MRSLIAYGCGGLHRERLLQGMRSLRNLYGGAAMIRGCTDPVVITCRVCGIDVEERPIKIAKKEQLSPQYLAVNPLGKLPCLQVTSGLVHVRHVRTAPCGTSCLMLQNMLVGRCGTSQYPWQHALTGGQLCAARECINPALPRKHVQCCAALVPRYAYPHSMCICVEGVDTQLQKMCMPLNLMCCTTVSPAVAIWRGLERCI